MTTQSIQTDANNNVFKSETFLPNNIAKLTQPKSSLTAVLSHRAAQKLYNELLRLSGNPKDYRLQFHHHQHDQFIVRFVQLNENPQVMQKIRTIVDGYTPLMVEQPWCRFWIGHARSREIGVALMRTWTQGLEGQELKGMRTWRHRSLRIAMKELKPAMLYSNLSVSGSMLEEECTKIHKDYCAWKEKRMFRHFGRLPPEIQQMIMQKVQPTKHYSNVHPCLSKNNPELGCLFPLRSVSHQFKAFVDRQIEMQGLVKKKPLNFQIRTNGNIYVKLDNPLIVFSPHPSVWMPIKWENVQNFAKFTQIQPKTIVNLYVWNEKKYDYNGKHQFMKIWSQNQNFKQEMLVTHFTIKFEDNSIF